jgi:tRNA(fMet)-specific endonuclease VapC
MRYLLDTNIVSDLVRNPQGRVANRVRDVGESNVCTSIVVAAELRYGAAKKESRRLTAQLEAVLEVLEVLPLEAPADAVYGKLRAHLERAGRVIGGNDLLIAAHALALRCAIVTDNEREFSRIEDLACENWMREGK